MPKTKLQNVIFTIIMAFVMVYAMVCYNIALDKGGMSNEIFLLAFHEIPIMWPVAFVLELFVVERLSKKLAFRIVSPEDKLQKMALSAAQAAAGSGGTISAEKLDKIITLLETIIRIIASGNTIEINGVKFAELLKKVNREYFKATGNYLLLDV